MFYGIGVGVGDRDMVTKKAIDIIKRLDILYVPTAKKDSGHSVAYEIIAGYLQENTKIKDRHFPMNYDSEELKNAWESIAKEMTEDVEAGKEVGFVTIGDPMVYSTYIYLLRILKDKIKVVTIPGIPSFLDIAANNNFPLVEGEDPLLILPATMDVRRLRKYIQTENALVLMKVYKNYQDILKIIIEEKLEHCTIAVSNSSKETEVVYRDIRDMKAEDVSYFTTILINKKWGGK